MRIRKGFLINEMRLVLIPFLNFAHVWVMLGNKILPTYYDGHGPFSVNGNKALVISL